MREEELSWVIFLSFVWAVTGLHFQLSVLHLLKHTQAHTHGQVGGLIAASEKASVKHSNGCNDGEQSCAVTLKAQVNYLLQSYIQPHMTERHTILAII